MTLPFIFDTNALIFILVGLLIVLVLWIMRLEWRINRLLRGSNTKSIEGSIIGLQQREKELLQFKNEIEQYAKSVESRLKKSVTGIHTVRFNPFKGTGVGGNQSFATAFMNEEKNGVVISTIHARERVGVFSKPIKNGTSEYELTDEEKEAIDKALISL